MTPFNLPRSLACCSALVLASLLNPPTVNAQSAAPSAAVAPAAPAAYRVDMLAWINDAQDKLEQLAAAMPETKYSWRPEKGVRSVGEVYLHVAQANFGLPASMGVAAPAGFQLAGYDTSMKQKAEIQKALHDSFEHMKSAFSAASEADLDKEAVVIGNKMTERHVYMLLLTHAHEHLGQSIAYARMNGVTPPWTEKQQERMKKAMEKPTAEKK